MRARGGSGAVLDEAEAALIKARELAPGSVSARASLGDLLFCVRHDFEGALRMYEEREAGALARILGI